MTHEELYVSLMAPYISEIRELFRKKETSKETANTVNGIFREVGLTPFAGDMGHRATQMILFDHAINLYERFTGMEKIEPPKHVNFGAK